MNQKQAVKVVEFCSPDVDQYIDSLMGWDLEFTQLSKGRGESLSYSVIGQDFSYLKFRHSKSAEQTALAEQNGLSFFLPAKSVNNIVLMSKSVTENVLCCAPQGDEIHVITPDNFSGYTLSVSFECIEAKAKFVAGAQGFDIPKTTTLYSLPEFIADAIRENLGFVCYLGGQYCLSDRDYLIHQVIETKVVPLLIRAMSSHIQEGVAGGLIREIKYLEGVLGFVNGQLESPPTVSELAKSQGITVRSLQQLFKRHLGVSPKEYVNVLRLNKVRKALSQQPVTRGAISDAANLYGFWHMGQFSKDYKALFSELPSKTLKK